MLQMSKKYFKRIILLVLGVINFQSVFSQENYIAGFVIKNNADTLFGFIDYRNWGINPNKIKFKEHVDSLPIVFNPLDIIEFRVKDEIYVSGIVNTEVSPFQTNRLDFDTKLKIKVDTTFLQTLISGKKSLFYYKNSDGKENFYIKQDIGFELLINKKYLIDRDGSEYINENKKFLSQLTLYLDDCPVINSRMKKTSYSQQSLIKVFQDYYECAFLDIYFKKEKEKIGIEIGVFSGVSITTLKMSSVVKVSTEINLLVNADLNMSVNYSGGLFLDFVLPRNQRKWSISNEIIFTSYRFKGNSHDFKDERNYSFSTLELAFSYLKINTLVSYKYPIRNSFLFLKGGMSNGFVLSETNFQEITSVNRLYENTEVGLALNDTRDFEQGIIMGSGLKYQRYSFEIRYEIGNGISVYPALKTKTNRYYFLFGYTF